MQSAGLCGPQPPAAEARYSHSLIHAVSPQAAARIYYKGICDSPSRAVRRRPTAADCNSLYARLRPPPSANSSLQKPIILKKNTNNNKKSTQIVVRYNYLYYFWDKRSVEIRRESRCCCQKPWKVESKTAIRGCPVGSLPRPDW